MNYYIFRHGQTFFSKNKIFYGKNNETAEILPEAIPVIKKLAVYLKDKDIDKAYTSPYKRTLQTVEIIEKETGILFKKDDRLGEQLMLYGKESFEDFAERLADFVNDIKNAGHENIAICSHGWPIAGLVASITNGEIQKSDLDEYPEAGELVVINEDKTIKTVNFNLPQ